MTTKRQAPSKMYDIHPVSIKLINQGNPWVTTDSYSEKFHHNDRFVIATHRQKPFALLIHDPTHKNVRARVWATKGNFQSLIKSFQKDLAQRIANSVNTERLALLFESVEVLGVVMLTITNAITGAKIGVPILLFSCILLYGPNGSFGMLTTPILFQRGVIEDSRSYLSKESVTVALSTSGVLGIMLGPMLSRFVLAATGIDASALSFCIIGSLAAQHVFNSVLWDRDLLWRPVSHK